MAEEAASAPEQGGGGAEEPPFDFQAAFERARDKRCAVAGVTLAGNARTRDHIILRELQPILLRAETLEEVKDGLLDACSRLTDLDIFSSVDLLADKSTSGLPHAADVLVTVVEKPVVSLHGGTYVQGDEGSVETTLKLNNAVGYAEQIEAHAAVGSQQSVACALSVTQQRLFGGAAAAEGRLGQTLRSFQKHSSFSEQLRGLSATLVSGPHRAEYELEWRCLTDPSRAASAAVRAQLGHSLKSALRHSVTLDRRDAAHMARRGWAARATTELAGIGPSDLLRFLRLEAEGVAVLPLARGAALALSLRGGVMLPWGAPPRGGRKPSHISDRFFLGGPDSLRGFCTKGVGPTDVRRPCADPAAAAEAAGSSSITRDALGGDLLCSAAAAVTFPLPNETLRSVGVHGHVFVNAGTVLPLSGPAAPRSVADVSRSLRAAAGTGVVFPTRIGRLEVNYCVTLRAMEHDRPKRGVQFGLRPSSL